MDQIFGMNFTLFIAILTAVATILSSLVTIVTTKIFENYQNTKKHERIVIEKILDTKLEACKKAIIFYGNYLNYLNSNIYTFKSLDSYEYSKIQSEVLKFVEDLIKKIPGLDVNENGKVSYNGNLLGQVLIDGNEFFGKNHKMATQNISAEMLEGVDLWKNYTTINGGKSSALNLRLKDQYKGKITGDLQTLYGSDNNYLFNSNIFKFSK